MTNINELLNKYDFVTLNANRVTIKPQVSNEEALDFVKEYYAFQQETDEEYYLDLKGLNLDTLKEIITYSLHYKDLKDKLVILNIINLIKTCNTLDDEVFKDENIYLNSLSDFLDFKLSMNVELKIFCRYLCMYYVALFKSYAKLEISFLDDAKDMPSLYGTIIASLDFFTLGSIFAKADPFDTEDCPIIKNAASYVINLVEKTKVANDLLEAILNKKE